MRLRCDRILFEEYADRTALFSVRSQPHKPRFILFANRFCVSSMLSFVVLGTLCSLNAVAQNNYNPLDFGRVAVKGASSQVLNFSFTGLSQAPVFALHYGIDFTAAAPACNSNGSSCTVSITFSPQYPGVRQDAIVVKNNSGAVLATQFLHGTGLGPNLTVYPTYSSYYFNVGLGPRSFGGIVCDMAGNY